MKCRCCGGYRSDDLELDNEFGFDKSMMICNQCKNHTIPMVRMYLAAYAKEK